MFIASSLCAVGKTPFVLAYIKSTSQFHYTWKVLFVYKLNRREKIRGSFFYLEDFLSGGVRGKIVVDAATLH